MEFYIRFAASNNNNMTEMRSRALHLICAHYNCGQDGMDSYHMTPERLSTAIETKEMTSIVCIAIFHALTTIKWAKLENSHNELASDDLDALENEIKIIHAKISANLCN
jgi:hypothetical protein